MKIMFIAPKNYNVSFGVKRDLGMFFSEVYCETHTSPVIMLSFI